MSKNRVDIMHIDEAPWVREVETQEGPRRRWLLKTLERRGENKQGDEQKAVSCYPRREGVLQ